MTLTEHLAELRRRLVICLVAVALGGVVAFIFYPQILDFLTGPYRDVCEAKNLTCPGKLVITDPLEGFAVRMKVTGYGGLVLALPVILWQIWRFVTPWPLREREALRDPVRLRFGGALPHGSAHRALDLPEGPAVPHLVLGRCRSRCSLPARTSA